VSPCDYFIQKSGHCRQGSVKISSAVPAPEAGGTGGLGAPAPTLAPPIPSGNVTCGDAMPCCSSERHSSLVCDTRQTEAWTGVRAARRWRVRHSSSPRRARVRAFPANISERSRARGRSASEPRRPTPGGDANETKASESSHPAADPKKFQPGKNGSPTSTPDARFVGQPMGRARRCALM
jgi:hypothetical protein